jgi:hypothetical protein
MRLTTRGRCDGFGAHFMAMCSGIAYYHDHGSSHIQTRVLLERPV